MYIKYILGSLQAYSFSDKMLCNFVCVCYNDRDSLAKQTEMHGLFKLTL